jgi:DNA-binding transcriptional MerR regulator
MSVVAEPAVDELMTVDELSAQAGLSVRTTRYYASLGLLPPPTRRGRLAYYDERHLARLSLIRTLQSHGFTLAAIESYVRRIPESTTPGHLAMQQAVLTAWAPAEHTRLDRAGLERRAGRPLDDEQVDVLVRSGVLVRHGAGPEGDEYEPLPGFEVGVELFDLSLGVDVVVEAATTIERHMTALADDLSDIMRRGVMLPNRAAGGPDVERTIQRLQALSVQAVVTGFQRATHDLITRTFDRSQQEES